MFYPEFILPVLLSNVLRPLVAFGGKIQGRDNQICTVFAMRVCPDIELNYSYQMIWSFSQSACYMYLLNPIGLGHTAENEEGV
jgi:hypothetical protein